MYPEAGGAGRAFAGTFAFADMTGDGVIPWSQACSVDVGGCIVVGELAAACCPGVRELFLWFEVGSDCGDSDWITRKDVGWLNGAAELYGWRRCLLTEAENDTGREAIGRDVPDAPAYLGGVDWAVINMGVVEVGLD